MIMKNKTTRKTLLQMSFQQTNKRGLAYNCEWCGEDSPFIAERYREDSHIWKRHLSLDCSPYYTQKHSLYKQNISILPQKSDFLITKKKGILTNHLS
jgi:hypothetical protein